LLNRAGGDCAEADEQKPESALRTSIGRTLVGADARPQAGISSPVTAIGRGIELFRFQSHLRFLCHTIRERTSPSGTTGFSPVKSGD